MIKPMLASKVNYDRFDEIVLKYKDFIVSPKIDGIRCIYENGIPYSRSGKIHRNLFIQKIFEGDLKKIIGDDYILDGELMCVDNEIGSSGENFSSNTQNIMSIKKIPKNLKYFIFDIVDKNLNARERYLELKKIKKHLPEWCIVLPKEILSDTTSSEIMEKYEEYLGNGFEGLMLQYEDSKYKNGRSTFLEAKLLKMKESFDSEAEIIGLHPLYTNKNALERDELGYAKRSTSKEGMVKQEMLGSFTCKTMSDTTSFSKDVVFSIGSGLTELQRKEMWENQDVLIGKIIKFKYFPHGGKDLPRCPVFLGIRDKNDL